MTLTDRVVSLLALVLMLAYFAVLAWKVRAIDLSVVLIIVGAMVVYDFYVRRGTA